MAIIIPDISQWQGDLPSAFFNGLPAIIMRAHNGNRPDAMFVRYWQACQRGTIRSGYGFAVASRSPVLQATEFCDVLLSAGWTPADGRPWGDFEVGGITPQFVDDYCGTVTDRLGRLCGAYYSASYVRDTLHDDASLRRWPGWEAAYGSNDGRIHPLPSEPWPMVLHQFTSNPGDESVALTGLYAVFYDDANPRRFTMQLNAPVVGSPIWHYDSTGKEDGYWLIGADGGVFGFGAASGALNGGPGPQSLADVHLAAPIVGGAATKSQRGLLLCGADGGTFALGDAPNFGNVTSL